MSIKTKILLRMVLTVLISLSVLGICSILLNIESTDDSLEQMLTEMSTVAAGRVQQELQAHTNVAMETGCDARLSSDISVKKKKEIIDQRAQAHGYQRGNVIGLDGKSIFDGKDYNDRDYVKHALQGETFISDPLISKITGELTIIVAAPLWDKGVSGKKVAGVVYFVPPETFLNDIVSNIHISEGSCSYMLNKNGTIIAHPDMAKLKNTVNTIEEAKSDESLAELAALETKMIGGENGFGIYDDGGNATVLAFSPVLDTDGWSIAISAPKEDFMEATRESASLTLIVLVIAVVISVIVALRMATRIGKPMAVCTKRLEQVAAGDFTTPVPKVRYRDETGRLANATESIVASLSGVIQDLVYTLGEMAGGNFDVALQHRDMMMGELSPIGTAMESLIDQQNDALRQINVAADQVANGSEQMANGAQALAQGATQQASSLEDLTTTVTNITKHLEETTDRAAKVQEQTNWTGSEINLCNMKMEELVQAMGEIHDASEKIGEIIATIENIAFQTNILALNAAVEAARAGESGKGFSVVADEVRALANKSQGASKDTAELIEHAVAAIQKGVNIAEETAQTLGTVVQGSQGIEVAINQIAEHASKQFEETQQAARNVEQISNIVQTNSATSEESAAASEELSGQSQMLKELVSHYKLRTEKGK